MMFLWPSAHLRQVWKSLLWLSWTSMTMLQINSTWWTLSLRLMSNSKLTKTTHNTITTPSLTVSRFCHINQTFSRSQQQWAFLGQAVWLNSSNPFSKRQANLTLTPQISWCKDNSFSQSETISTMLNSSSTILNSSSPLFTLEHTLPRRKIYCWKETRVRPSFPWNLKSSKVCNQVITTQASWLSIKFQLGKRPYTSTIKTIKPHPSWSLIRSFYRISLITKGMGAVEDPNTNLWNNK